jgi:hypothetical protein
VLYVLRQRYGRASGRFGGVVGYIEGTLEELRETWANIVFAMGLSSLQGNPLQIDTN